MNPLRAFAERRFPGRQADRDRVASWLLSGYLGVAAAYWLPGLDQGTLAAIKVTVWAAAVGLVLLPAVWEGQLKISRGMRGPWAFAAILLLAYPGLVRANDARDLTQFVIDVGAGAVFLWCFFDLARRGFDLGGLLRRAALVVSALSAVSLGAVLLDITDWNFPCRSLFQSPATSGFGAERTGWALGLALLLPAVGLTAGRRSSRATVPVAVIGAGLILASQFAAGGRTGLAMSGITVLVFLLRPASRRLALALLGIGFVLAWTAMDKTCLRHLRIPAPLAEAQVPGRPPTWWTPKILQPLPPHMAQAFSRGLRQAQTTGNTLDYVGGHRFWQFRAAWERVAERPLAGHGWRQVLFPDAYSDRLVEPHNLWLKWALYAGLAAPLWFALIALSILAAAVRLVFRLRRTEDAGLAATLALIVFLGLFASLSESAIPVGSFHLSAIWWAAAGAALGLETRLRERERAATEPPATPGEPVPRPSLPLGETPPVSIVIPARNAEDTLPATLEAALSQEYGGPVEVIVADGSDTPATAELVRSRFPEVRLVENPERTTPAALNRALAAAAHPVVVRCDAHAVLPPRYLAQAVSTLARTGAANVGGRQTPVGRTLFERAVALATTSLVGAGGARWRVGGREGPAHTVYLGAFRREALEAVGGFDQSLIRNQDYDLNWRLRAAGEIVWFDPALSVAYRPRSDLRALARQYFEYGWWKRVVLDRYPESNRVRFWPAPLLMAGLVLSLAAAGLGVLLQTVGGEGLGGAAIRAAAIVPALYLAALLVGSLLAGLRRADAAAGLMPLVLAVIHLAWGAGFWLASGRSAPPAEPDLRAEA